MDKKITMRVNISFGYTCESRCVDKIVEFEIPVTAKEKELLGQLPECTNGKTTDLQALIPSDLYKRMLEASLCHVEDYVYINGYENGMYILDARKWYLKDLADGVFCQNIGDGIFLDPNSGITYEAEDDELFELWQEYEDKCYEAGGISYLRERYDKELAEQTNLAALNWSMEF